MSNKKIWSAIKNGYTASVSSPDELISKIKESIKNKQELSIVHYESKTIIKVCRDSNNKWKAIQIK